MATIKLRLNPSKPGNYAFFCPVTRLHLTLTNPVGSTDRVSNYILRGIKSKTLIDVDNVVDLSAGELKTETTKKVEAQVKSQETTASIQNQKESLSQEAEVVVDDKKLKRGKRAQNNLVDEVTE